jgi:hypothetical protein
MKTSNIIIIAFFVFVLAGMLTLFIYTEKHENKLDVGFVTETIDLPSFSVIVAEPTSKLFTVESGKSNKLIINKLKKEKNEASPYVIDNDTLRIVEQYNPVNPERSFIIQCTDVHTIIARQDNDIRLCGFDADSLTFAGNTGFLIMGADHADKTGREDCHIKYFTFIGKNRSYLSVQHTNIDQMTIRMNNSTAAFNDKNAIKQANVDIENNSLFQSQGPNADFVQLTFKSDKTSFYSIEKQKDTH